MTHKVKLRRRNPLHNHPLLFKGSAHHKTNKSKRRMEKVKMKKEWLPQNIFSQVYFEEVFLLLGVSRLIRKGAINLTGSAYSRA